VRTPRRSPLRRLAVIGLTCTLGLGLAGCAVGQATQEWYDPADGANTTPDQPGDLAIRGAQVVVLEDGTAEVWATFVNSGTELDRVVAITVDGVPATIDGGSLSVGPGLTARLGAPADVTATLPAGTLVPGLLADVEFAFSVAPEATLPTQIQDEARVVEEATR
jgi:hypothetical protein